MTITVGTDTYIAVVDADAYLAQSVSGAGWAVADTPTKEKCLVSATRILERQVWVGTKTGSPQTLSWPRTGVVDKDGTAVDPATVPQQIKDAECELALLLLTNPALTNTSDTGSTIKSVKAGPVGVDFFKTPTSKVTKFPPIVNDLVAQFLSSSTTGVPAVLITGSDNPSQFPACGSFNINRGF